MKGFLQQGMPPLWRVLACLVLGLSAVAPAQAGFVDHFAEAGDIGRNKVPRTGSPRVLAIPVIIEDLPTPDWDAWKTFLGEGQGETFTNYYRAASLGKFSPSVTVARPVTYSTCPLPKSWRNCAIPRGDVSALGVGVKFLRQIIQRAVQEQGIDLKDFDLTGPDGEPDGWVDGILLMPNGEFPGIALPISNPTLMQYARMISPGLKLSAKAFENNGVKVGAVAIASAFSRRVVVLHEFGHLLGWGDLYHEHAYGRGLYFSLMGQYDDGLPFPDAMSRLKIGWGSVKPIQGAVTTYRLAPVETSGEVLRFGGEKQYFLLENRGPGETFSRLPKQRGLAVYRVDETQYPKNSELAFIEQIQKCLNCDLWSPLVMNVPSDPSFPVQNANLWKSKAFEKLLFGPGDELAPDTTGRPLSQNHQQASTNLPDGTPTGVVIRHLRFEGDTLVLDAGVPEE